MTLIWHNLLEPRSLSQMYGYVTAKKYTLYD